MDSVRAAVRQNGARVNPDLAGRVQRTVQDGVTDVLDGGDGGDYAVSVDVDLVADRVPGAPRERVTIDLDLEGDDSVVAAIDDAVTAPDRARLADALEATTLDYLKQHELHEAVEVTVSVTPIQFR